MDGEGQSSEESVKGRDSDEKEPASNSITNVPPRFGGLFGPFGTRHLQHKAV